MKKCWLALLMLAALPAAAEIAVRDDGGAEVRLARPAQRVATLAPHATELVFAAGGGERMVGASDYSDYPPAARALPRIGGSQQIDTERLIALRPDLLVVWLHGNTAQQLAPLRRLGVALYQSEPGSLEDIPDEIERLGRLMGTERTAQPAAAALRSRLAQLAARYRERPAVKVFYQVSERPLYTLNGRQIVSDAIRLCGGVNVFADLPVLAPAVTVEAVLQADPEIIIAGARGGQDAGGLAMWKRYPGLLAVRRGNLYSIESDLIGRAGPRMIDGAEALCKLLDQARARRGTK